MPNFSVILPAAGKSSRFKDKHYKKPFANLAGRAVWIHAAEKFLNRDDCTQMILVIGADDREQFDMKFAANTAIMGITVVEGGQQRADSIENALAKVSQDADFVVVHDAARPCLAALWIDRVFEAAEKTGAAMLATPVSGTLKRVSRERVVEETLPRQDVWEAQTPQVFRRELLVEAYAKREGMAATDDAQLVERLGQPVSIVMGSPLNLKITTKEDLRLAELALKVLPKPKLDGPAHPFAGDDMWR
jgi:2-C-methyl-D-erythritol 4-phosphate cytidylyltransferase